MQPMDPNDLDPTGELAERLNAQEVEYGTYRAKGVIYAGLTPAYNVGAAVPVSNVVKHGYWFNGQVELVEGREHAPEIADQIARQEAEDKQRAESEAEKEDEGDSPKTDV